MALDSANFDLDSFDSAHLSCVVHTVHLVAYQNEGNTGDEKGNPPTIHWAVFLQHSDTASVRVDMTPGYGSNGLKGKIELASKSYRFTYQAIKRLTFLTSNSPTVHKILDGISSKGRTHYFFTEDWKGCRYWNFTFISDLEIAGILLSGSAGVAWDAVSCYWRYPSGFEPRPVSKGCFLPQRYALSNPKSRSQIFITGRSNPRAPNIRHPL